MMNKCKCKVTEKILKSAYTIIGSEPIVTIQELNLGFIIVLWKTSTMKNTDHNANLVIITKMTKPQNWKHCNFTESMDQNVHIFHTMHSFHPTFQKCRCENWKSLNKENRNNKKEQLSRLGLYLDCLNVLF